MTEDYAFAFPWRGWIRVFGEDGRLLVELNVFQFKRKRDLLRILMGRINRVYVLGSDGQET